MIGRSPVRTRFYVRTGLLHGTKRKSVSHEGYRRGHWFIRGRDVEEFITGQQRIAPLPRMEDE